MTESHFLTIQLENKGFLRCSNNVVGFVNKNNQMNWKTIHQHINNQNSRRLNIKPPSM